MVTAPPEMPARVRPPTVSLKRTLPELLLAAKEETSFAWVFSVMAEPLPLTVKAPALTAAV